jgi:hypothetical protein
VATEGALCNPALSGETALRLHFILDEATAGVRFADQLV